MSNDIEIIHPSSKDYRNNKKIDIEFMWNDRPFKLCRVELSVHVYWEEETLSWESMWSDEVWVNFIDLDSGLMYEIFELLPLQVKNNSVPQEQVIDLLKWYLDDNGLPEFEEVQNG